MLTELRYEPRWAFMLQIAGVGHRFYGVRRRPGGSFEPPPASLRPETASHAFGDYIDVPALVMVHPAEESTDGIGGVAQHTPVSVELARSDHAPDRAPWAPLDDPAVVLGRIPTKPVALLREAVDEVTLEWPVDRDLSGWSFPARVDCGQEVVRATGFAGDGPATWRLLLDTRGALDTIPRGHAPTAALAEYPALWSDHCRTWHHRPAKLYAAPIYGDMYPALGPWTLVHPGFLETTPNTDRPDAVEIEISPPTGYPDRRMDFARQVTTLAEGFHAFTDDGASLVQLAYGFAAGALYRGTTAATLAGAGVLNVEATAPHEQFFDATLYPLHPRAGAVAVALGDAERSLFVQGYNAGPPESFTVANNQPRSDVEAGLAVESMAACELKRSFIVEPGGARRIVAWPDVLAELDDDLMPGTHLGVDGAWADATFDAGSGRLAVFPNWPRAQQTANDLRVFLYDPHVSIVEPDGIDNVPTWPFLQGGPTPFPEPLTYDDDDNPIFLASARHQLHYGLWRRDAAPTNGRRVEMGSAGAWIELFGLRANLGRAYDVLNAALGFYQRGERYILAREQISHPDGWPAWVKVVYEEPWITTSAGGPPQVQTNLIKIIGDEAVVLGDGSTAYLLEVDDPEGTRSFGSFDGAEPAQLTVDFPPLSGPQLLETILTAEYALAIPAAEVDVASLYRFTDPPGLQFGWPATSEPTDGREALRGVLVATRTALVNRLSTGGKLTRVYIGPENAQDVIEEFTDDDWLAGQVPTYDTAKELIHEVTIRCNYGPDGEPQLIERFVNKTLNDEAGFDLKEEELDLPGLIVDSRRDLVAVAAGVFASFGRPRRVWTLPIELGRSLSVHIGACVRVTSAHLKGVDDAVGVTAAIGRVVELQRDWLAGTAELIVIHWGVETAGYAPAIEITGVVDAKTVEIDGTARAGVDPLTGEARTVFDLFKLTDRVRVVPDGGDDAAVTRRIAAWDQVAVPPTITFGPVNPGDPSEHSITTTGYIEPAAGAAMEPHHQGYARFGAGYVFA